MGLFPTGAAAAPFAYDAAASEELSNTVPGGDFSEPFGLTFDSAGNLYVTDTNFAAGSGVVDKFNSENVFQAQLGSAAFTDTFGVRGVAVNDETGHIYVGQFSASSFTGSLYALDADGAELSRWLGSETPTGAFGEHFVQVAVDNSPGVSHGNVYVMFGNAEGGEVDVLEPQNGDAEEGKLIGTLVAPGGFEFNGLEGIAVDQATGQVYVVDQGHKVVDRFSPSGVFEAAAQLAGPSSTEPFAEPIAVAVDPGDGHVFVIDHRAGVVAGGLETVDEFGPAGELVRQITETEPNQPLVQPTGVAIQTTGPHAGAVYVADAGAKAIDVFAELPPAAPQIESEGVTVAGSTATLLGEVDARGAPTGYRFEYGACATPTTCAATPFEHTSPVPDATLGFEDFNAHAVAPVQFGGLIAGTAYHFRLVAHNALGETFGEERSFTDPAASPFALPDRRQWQLVSPVDKHGAVVAEGGESGLVHASADGSAVSYLANAPTEADPAGSASGIQVLSARAGGSWSSRDLATPHEAATGNSPGTSPEYRFFAEEDGELSGAVVQPFGRFNPHLSSEATEQTPYLRTLGACASGCYRPLVTASNTNGVHFGAESVCQADNEQTSVAASVCGPRFEAATPDASHVILRSAEPLTPGAPTGEVKPGGAGITGGLYEWSAGRLQLVSVLPANEAGEELPAPVDSEPRLGAELGTRPGSARRAISADGSRIFWTAAGDLYMRDTAAGETIELDSAEPACLLAGHCESGGGRFQIASADGSRVFFTDSHPLTADSGAVNQPGNLKVDLYECRIVEVGGRPSCDLTDLTPIASEESADVQGDVLGASADGSLVYFVADGTLGHVAGAEPGNCRHIDTRQPVGATCNLFLLRDGRAPRLVAVLSGRDAKSWLPFQYRPARVSSSGRWLAFLSQTPLTGYDNRDAVSGKTASEAFLFDAATDELHCASCNPTGARPIGVEYKKVINGASEQLPAIREQWEEADWVSALFPSTTAFAKFSPDYQPRYLSDSGRLYFNSLDALVPSDTNATGDVYQYESPGVGSCTTTSSTYSTQDGGCVDLISSGTSPQRSAFLDASESGDDVFFFTSSKLSPQDVDGAEDVYDAHSCEEAAGCLIEPAAPTPPCSGESCQGQAGAPAEARPQSQSFSGPGNPVICRKGQVRKGGRCVAKHHKAKKHKKKSGKKHKK